MEIQNKIIHDYLKLYFKKEVIQGPGQSERNELITIGNDIIRICETPKAVYWMYTR